VNASRERPCIGCGALVPDVDGPTHAYLDASPGCWELFGQILAREYREFRHPMADRREVRLSVRLTVDAYAVQHPGVSGRSARDRRAIHSVAVHLISLYLVLERGLPADAATEGMRRALRDRERFRHLEPPGSLGEVTVVDVLAAKDLAEHEALARRWARSAWEAWSPHHETIRRWAEGGDD
jgi:hypothetical protein